MEFGRGTNFVVQLEPKYNELCSAVPGTCTFRVARNDVSRLFMIHMFCKIIYSTGTVRSAPFCWLAAAKLRVNLMSHAAYRVQFSPNTKVHFSPGGGVWSNIPKYCWNTHFQVVIDEATIFSRVFVASLSSIIREKSFYFGGNFSQFTCDHGFGEL